MRHRVRRRDEMRIAVTQPLVEVAYSTEFERIVSRYQPMLAPVSRLPVGRSTQTMLNRREESTTHSGLSNSSHEVPLNVQARVGRVACRRMRSGNYAIRLWWSTCPLGST